VALSDDPTKMLEYAHNDLAVPRRRVYGLLILASLCTLVAACTAIRIEILNIQAGHVLPRHVPGKWRAIGGFVAVQAWRSSEASDRNDPSLTTRPLTPAEQRQLNAYVRRQDADADLRDVVGSWGLLQYPLVLVGLFLAQLLTWAGKSTLERRAGAVFSLVLVACGVLMFCRSYFGSLGW
jgi:hypothetical protein